MSGATLYWNVLRCVGDLPDELIVKILYEFRGLKHPVVTMLLDDTKVTEYEELQKLPISKIIYNFYLHQEKYQAQYNYSIIDFINNQQKSYYRVKDDHHTHYNNPGCFFPRQFGRLYYNTLNDNDLVDTKIHVDWKLNRSKKIYYSHMHRTNIVSGTLRFRTHMIAEGATEAFENESYVYKLIALEKFFKKEYPGISINPNRKKKAAEFSEFIL